MSQAAEGPGHGVITARVRTRDGWAVRHAVLTVTDMAGQQVARTGSSGDGMAEAGPLPPGTYTAIVMATGYAPAARTAMVTAEGPATLGTVVVERAGGSQLPAPGQWTIDPGHSSVTAIARHIGIASIRGRINRFSGAITIAEPVEQSTVQARMESESVDTGNKDRDDHLRSADFLHSARYPDIEFASTGVTPVGGERWAVDGELTLRGVSRPVRLDLSYLGTGPDPFGGTRAAFRATTELHREDFAVNWNQAFGSGILAVGTTLQIELDIEAVQGDLPQF
jgi:polyisoprenoid-binding protein YceI